MGVLDIEAGSRHLFVIVEADSKSKHREENVRGEPLLDIKAQASGRGQFLV